MRAGKKPKNPIQYFLVSFPHRRLFFAISILFLISIKLEWKQINLCGQHGDPNGKSMVLCASFCGKWKIYRKQERKKRMIFNSKSQHIWIFSSFSNNDGIDTIQFTSGNYISVLSQKDFQIMYLYVKVNESL